MNDDARNATWPVPGSELSAADWDRILQIVNVPSLLVAIDSRIGPELRLRCDVEDVWQETLHRAWRDRAGFEWRGVSAFRHWLIRIAEHVIQDLVDAATADKRGGGSLPVSLSIVAEGGSSTSDDHYAGPVTSTTPSRVAADREQAALFLAALESLPDDLRLVVYLRIFEDLPIGEVAERAGIGESAVRHRLRKGLGVFSLRLKSASRLSNAP